jgi:hypothetical protein
MKQPGSGWTMKDFRWRPSSRRPRRRSPFALPDWLTSLLAVVLVLGSCAVAAALVQPQVEKFMAAAGSPAPDATGTSTPRAAGSVLPPGGTRTPGANTPTTAPPSVEPGTTVPLETPSDTPEPPTPEITDTPSAAISVGATVVVVNTGGIGVSVREEPSVNAALVRIAPEGTQLTVVDGPTEADGYVWWKVHADDGSADGWSAEQFLEVVTP